MTTKTYGHRIPGSSIVTPTGQVFKFSGAKSGPGFLTTSDEAAIAMLDWLVKDRLSQVFDADGSSQDKPLDPAVAEAAAAAMAAAERSTDPAVIAAQENLGKLIAAESQT